MMRRKIKNHRNIYRNQQKVNFAFLSCLISFVLHHVVNQFHDVELDAKLYRPIHEPLTITESNFLKYYKNKKLTKLRGRHCYMTLLAIVHHSVYIICNIKNITIILKELSHGQTT